MPVDQELVDGLKAAMTIVQADLSQCEAAQADTSAGNSDLRGIYDPPRSGFGGGIRRDGPPAIGINCSDLVSEMHKLQEELDRALRGDLPTDPSFPASTPYEKEAMQKAAQQRQKMIALYKSTAKNYALLAKACGAGAALMGATTFGLGVSGVGLPGVPIGAGVTVALGAGVVVSGFTANHLDNLASQLEAPQ